MPTPTYTPLATVTLGSSASSVTFSSIPATYRDLVLVMSGTTTSIQAGLMRLNGDTGSNYSQVGMDGSGSSTSSFSGTVNTIDVWANGTTVSQASVVIMDYSATDKHKTVLNRIDNSTWGTRALAARWANTAAITSILVYMAGGQSFNTGSTFNLYGVIA
jgi:hypothetical protein